MLLATLLLLAALTWGPQRGGCGNDDRLPGRVCESVDARNTAESLVHDLQDCRVVEGYVRIQLIDPGNSNDTAELEKLSFPKLREISHHLLLYRVSGLRSLAQLFPNLAVIRGASLFNQYALVAYEMFSLQDVALPKLAVIARGGVLLEKNPLLCYVNTVDWSRIVKDRTLGENGLRLREGRMMPCPQVCPAHCVGGGQHARCWNEQYCQQSACPARCGDAPCFTPHSNAVPDAAATSLSRWAPSLECCHKECLGGCWGPEAHQCYLCRNAMYNQSCVATCPRGLVRIHMSRCITEQQCQYVPSTTLDTVGFVPKPWRVFNGTCVPFCPQGYEEHTEDGRLTCHACGQGGCKIICTSNKVDTIAKAQLLEGCTHINTSLEIQINGGKDVSQELEAYLGAIEEIDNFLKITRSFSLLNLNFLKSLRVIHGKLLEKGKYSLVVLDNPNLQDLWDWESRDSDLTLENGSIFFHLNPKLCPREIQRLQDATRLPAGSFSEQDVSNVTNGDEVECIVVDLKARVTTKLVTGVILEWEVLSVPKHSSLLGYLVYSIEAPFQNVSAYDGLDVCGGNDWRVDDVASATSYDDEGLSADGDPRKVYQILTRLNPNTQYAFYVKTYSLTTASHYGGQSPIQYFTTLPSRPSPPVNLRALSSQHSELVVQWDPPVHFNGNLSHYLVVGQWMPDDHKFLLEQRDYCQHPMIRESLSESVSKQVSQPCNRQHHGQQLGQHTFTQHTPVQQQPDECPARCGGLPLVQGESSEPEKEDCFFFHLYALHYEQEINHTGMAQEMFPQDEALDPERKNESRDPAASRNFTVGGVLHEFSYTIPAHLNNVTARPLRHFGLYSIQVWACRHPHPEEPFNAERCSSATQISVRTAPKTDLDQVTSVNATVIGPSEVKLYWIPPVKPNGLVLAFHIESRREGERNFQPYVQCLSVNPHVTPEEETYKLDNLQAGTYSVKIRTISLAGEGPYSDKATFVLHSSVDSEKTGSVKKSILITLASFIPIIGAICLLCWKQRRHKTEAEDVCLIASVNPDYVSANYTEDEWELVRDRVTLIRELGQGSFGMVYEGELTSEGSGSPIPCAIKTMNESANCREKLQFLHEASVMKAFNAHHVVHLLGVVSRGQPTLVVMELMTLGDLKTYLRSNRDTGEPSPTRLLHMASQIADGMLYLSTKKFVHRDLAARNCMVSQDLTVKIGDFGMTRDIYETDYYRKGSKGLLPVRWMAPESLHDGVFTSSSDVWSYGVVLWEMATHAEQPYQGQSNEQVLQQILSGCCLTPPDDCPEVLYIMMQACWQRSPLARPTFINLLERLLPLIPAEFAQVSFYHGSRSTETSTSTQQPRPILAPTSNGVAMHFSSP